MLNFALSFSTTALVAAFLSHSGFSQSAQFIPIPGASSVPGTNSNFCGISGSTGYAAVRLSADGSTVATVVYDPGFVNGAVPMRVARWTETSGTVVLTPQLGGNLYPCTGISADGSTIYGEYWRWTATGGYENLAPLLGSQRLIFGCSDDGQTITGTQGTYYGPSSNIDLFRWNLSGGVPQILPRPASIPAAYFYQNSISGDGRVVGGSTMRPGGGFALYAAARIDTNGVQLITQETSSESVTDLSFDGSVAVGFTQMNGFQSRAFRWEAATGTVLIDNAVGNNGAFARAVDADGDVIVGDYYTFGSGGTRAFMWRQGLGFLDLQDELEVNYGLAQQLAGWKLEIAIDVSADGRTIVGSALNPQGCNQAFLVRLFPPIGQTTCLGQPNSTGAAATISVAGSNVVGANQTALVATRLPANTVGYFLSARAAAQTPLPGFGQGLLCLAAPIGRHNRPGEVLTSGVTGRFVLQLELADIPTPTGTVAVLAGETWHFQAWYRDTNPTPTSNLTSGVRVLFL